MGGRLFCSPDGTTDMEGAPLQRHLVFQAQCDQNYPPALPSAEEPAPQEGDAGLEDAPLPPQEGDGDGDGEDALVIPTTSPLCFCGFPEACMVVPQVPCRSDDAVEPKGVEDDCFAHQTGQQTWKVHLFSGTWFLRHSVSRCTHPAAHDFAGLYMPHYYKDVQQLAESKYIDADSDKARLRSFSANYSSKRVGCRCNAFPFSVGRGWGAT